MVRNSSEKGLERVHPVQGLLNAPVHPGAFCLSNRYGSSSMCFLLRISNPRLAADQHSVGKQGFESNSSSLSKVELR